VYEASGRILRRIFGAAPRGTLAVLLLLAPTGCAITRSPRQPEAVVAAATPSAVSDGATAPALDDDDSGKKSLTEVNKQLTNPVSSLWSITFEQNNFLATTGPGGPLLYNPNLLFQPVLPLALTDDWNLITRPVIPFFVSQQHPVPDKGFVEPTAGIGDITLLQLLSPSPKLAGDWLLGLGPSWIFPAASSRWTGQGKWQVGPAALAGYLSDKWILAALVQNWTSYGGSGPEATNGMNLQPVAAYFLPDGWSIGYSGNILANWKATGGNAWTVPLGLSVSKVVKLGPLPVRFALGGQYMVVNPREFGQKWNIQLIIAPVLPKLIRGNMLEPSSLQFGLPKRPSAP
jgi:hypothetical protein